MTILCFVTSRPSYSRIKTVLAEFENIGLDYGVVCLASATEPMYGDISKMIESDGYRVIRRFSTQLASTTGETAAKTTALGLLSATDIISQIRPRAVISIADRYETISTAIAASYQNVPCVHIQGGEITGNIDDKVRDAVSALSDIHFPSTEAAANRLRGFVKRPEKIYNFGCPSVDLFMNTTPLTRQETLSIAQKKSVGSSIDSGKPYAVVMMHPDTDESDGSLHFLDTMLACTSRANTNFFWFWPNSDPGSDMMAKKLRGFRESELHTNIRFVKNLEPGVFVNLLRHSIGLIGNSSVGVREAGILGLPTIDVGNRQANRQKHENVVSVTYSTAAEDIMSALSRKRIAPSYVYGRGDAGKRIATCIAELYGNRCLQRVVQQGT